MAEFDGITHFHKSGWRHLRDAQELLETPTREPNKSDAATRHQQGAVYLAGYAVECALKEFLISREGVGTLSEVMQRRRQRGEEEFALTTTEGHNLALLFRLANLAEECEHNSLIRRHWASCVKWRSTLRYSIGTGIIQDPRGFVVSAEEIHRWILNLINSRAT